MRIGVGGICLAPRHHEKVSQAHETGMSRCRNKVSVSPSRGGSERLREREKTSLMPPYSHIFWVERLTDELFSALKRLRVELVPKYAEDMSLHLAFWDELNL